MARTLSSTACCCTQCNAGILEDFDATLLARWRLPARTTPLQWHTPIYHSVMSRVDDVAGDACCYPPHNAGHCGGWTATCWDVLDVDGGIYDFLSSTAPSSGNSCVSAAAAEAIAATGCGVVVYPPLSLPWPTILHTVGVSGCTGAQQITHPHPCTNYWPGTGTGYWLTAIRGWKHETASGAYGSALISTCLSSLTHAEGDVGVHQTCVALEYSVTIGYAPIIGAMPELRMIWRSIATPGDTMETLITQPMYLHRVYGGGGTFTGYEDHMQSVGSAGTCQWNKPHTQVTGCPGFVQGVDPATLQITYPNCVDSGTSAGGNVQNTDVAPYHCLTVADMPEVLYPYLTP